MAESDPLAAIIMHHNVTAELVGVSDRVLLISREWDFIERVKLLGLGVAKSFLVGETSFAAAVAGLQTLMERLASLRLRFENDWIIKKICAPIAEIHELYRRPQAELDHRIRIKRPLEERELMVPKIKWAKSLEPTQDVAILNIWRDLKERGILSERTYSAGAGVDIDAERKNISEERKYKQEHPEVYGVPQQQQQQPPGGKPGAPGAPPGAKPPVPPASEQPRFRANNPYVRPARMAMSAELEDRLYDLSDGESKVDVQDVMEVIEDIDYEEGIDARASALLDDVPVAGSDLLSGK